MGCFFFGSCQTSKNLRQGTGWVLAKTATRGSQQYLIVVDNQWYYPEELPEKFKMDSVRVQVKYRVLDRLDTVFKPAPNDLLEFDFTARAIKVKKIKLLPQR
ncbi:hypothetical protein QWY93_13555 [Echinicola jeungdonensis]|nr:hypothetical protein [Echinicola jeungdonensis]MDN3670298.1 hypothetical protein [Echinicola jeungdonensis]MDN3670344.1 hypothetical protein [Echinicola jeungdonensis]